MPEKPELQEYRVPPQDYEAEASVLGAMMLDQDACSLVLSKLTAGAFYKESHQKIFNAIAALRKAEEPVDMITLSNQLKKAGDWEGIEGAVGVLTSLFDRVPTAANAEHYANILIEKASARRIISVCTKITADAYEDRLPIEELLAGAVDRLEKATQIQAVLGIDDTMDRTVDKVMGKLKSYQSGEDNYYVSSGFHAFDERFGGWERGKLYVVRGNAKRGKTLLVHNSALQICGNPLSDDSFVPVGYYYGDSAKEDMIWRTLSLLTKAPIQDLTSSDMVKKRKHERAALEACEFLKTLPFYLAGLEDIGTDPQQLLGWIRRSKERYDIKIAFVDSVSILDYVATKDKTMERVVADLANQFVKLAAKLDIPIVVISEVAQDQENGQLRSKYSGRWDFAAYATFDVDRPQDDKTKEFGDLMTVKAALHRGGRYGTAQFKGREKQFRLQNLHAGYGDKNIFTFKESE